MRVLRTGGEFTAQQMQKERLGILLGIAVALAIAAASALFWHPAGMFLGLVPALGIARPCYRRLVRFQKGAVGEQSVADLLARLPEDYVLPKLTSHSVGALAQILLDGAASGRGNHKGSRPHPLHASAHQRPT